MKGRTDMAYFPNGDAGRRYLDPQCETCTHGQEEGSLADGYCVVRYLHESDEVEFGVTQKVLDFLMPMPTGCCSSAKCAMWVGLDGHILK